MIRGFSTAYTMSSPVFSSSKDENQELFKKKSKASQESLIQTAKIRILISEGINPSKNLKFFQGFISSQFNRDKDDNRLINSTDQIEQVMRDPRLWRQTIEEDPTLALAMGADPQSFLQLAMNLTREAQKSLLPISSRLLATFNDIEDFLPEMNIHGYGNNTFLSLLEKVIAYNNSKFDQFWGKSNESDYFYTGYSLSSYGIISNQAVLSQYNISTPSTWTHLTEKQYYELLGLPILKNTNSMAIRIFETILQTYGWEEGWMLLTHTYANGNGSLLQYSDYINTMDIYNGLVGAGWSRNPPLVFDSNLQIEQGRLNETFFDHKACAVLTNALQDPFTLEFCARFLAFLLSIEDYEHNPGGQTINLISGNPPINPATKYIIQITPELFQNLVTLFNTMTQTEIEQRIEQTPNLGELVLNSNISDLFVLDEVLAYQRAQAILLLFETMIHDSFDDLKIAWNKLLENDEINSVDLDNIGKVPINETEAVEIGLILRETDDDEIRESYYDEWKDFADYKYERVKEGETFTGMGKRSEIPAFEWEICILMSLLLSKNLRSRKRKVRMKNCESRNYWG